MKQVTLKITVAEKPDAAMPAKMADVMRKEIKKIKDRYPESQVVSWRVTVNEATSPTVVR